MRVKLLRMIELLTIVSQENEVDTWYEGKQLEKWADEAILRQLKGCFSDYDKLELYTALQKHIELYHFLSTKIASQLGFEYPHSAKEQVGRWISTQTGWPMNFGTPGFGGFARNAVGKETVQ